MKIISIICFWFITLSVMGQKPFNHLHDFGFIQAGARLMVEVDDGYVLVGQAFVDTIAKRQIYLSKHKFNGENTLVRTWHNNQVESSLYGFGDNAIIESEINNKLIFSFFSPSLGSCIAEFKEEEIDTLLCFRELEENGLMVLGNQIFQDSFTVGLLSNPRANINLVKINLDNEILDYEIINVLTDDKYQYSNAHLLYDQILIKLKIAISEYTRTQVQESYL